MRQDGSRDWSIAMEGCRLFQDSKGRGRRFALYASVHLHCIELCLDVEKEMMESLRVGIKVKTGKGDNIVGVCYRSPSRKEQVAEASTDRQ